MSESQIKHLEFIQDIITRMNSNSFTIKNWMIAFLSGLLALYASSNEYMYIFVAIVPTMLFWFLDTSYLQQEKKFRKLYNDIVLGKNIIPFSMPIQNYDVCYFDVLFSKTIWPLYLPIIIFLTIGGLFAAGVITFNC